MLDLKGWFKQEMDIITATVWFIFFALFLVIFIFTCVWELLQVMTSVSVPSTLVKCLYLFFDLPEIENPDTAENGSEFTPRERRILLQKIFVQVNKHFFLYLNDFFVYKDITR
jgi:hypothetical protein